MSFEIDERATIRSILIALGTEGVKTGDVAKAIPGISEKPFRTALKAAGYEFSNKAPKGWHYIGEGEEPLARSIFDYVNKSSSRKKSSSPAVHIPAESRNVNPANNNKSNSPMVPGQFSEEEIKMIKEMLESWKKFASNDKPNSEYYSHVVDVTPTIHDRIKALPQDEKTRKTIVIDKSIGKRLDEFCKTERVNKSDVLHLALKDFLERV